MILLLALRNLFRHFRSTLLLLLVTAFIALLFFLGSSLISQSAEGLRKTYVDNLTADLVVQKTGPVSMNLFGANTPIIDDFFTLPVLPAFQEVRKRLSSWDGVEDVSPLVSGKAVMDLSGVRNPIPLMGIEAETYFSLFPGITMEEGPGLTPGEEGILLTRQKIIGIETRSGNEIKIGDPVLLTSAGQRTFSIREVPLKGIFSYRNPGPYMEEMALCDPQTVRALSSALTVAAEDVEVEEDALALLDGDTDDLFGDLFGDEPETEGEEALTLDSLADIFKEDNAPAVQNEWKGGDWNFLLIKLKPGVPALWARSRLNAILEENGVRVVGWQTAAGNSALLVLLLQSLFYGGMLLVGLAAVATIVNIVLISVFRRTRELGTLRAIGASDGFIGGMILMENALSGCLGGLGGIGIGLLLARKITDQQFPITNPMLAALAGSSHLQILPSAGAGFQAFCLAALLGTIAALFPSYKALTVNPMEAVRKG